MLKLLKRTAFVGIGLAAMNAKTIRRLGNKIAEEGKLSEAEGQILVSDLLEQSEKAKADLKENINNTVKESISDMNLATAEDIEDINTHLKVIERTLKHMDTVENEPTKEVRVRTRVKPKTTSKTK